MKSSSIVRACVLAVAGAFAMSAIPGSGPVTLGPAPVSAAEAACIDGWRQVRMPTAADPSYLMSVVSDGKGPRWLLGGSHEKGSIAFRRGKGGWKRVPISDGGTRGLTGGSTANDRDVAISGYVNTPQIGLIGRMSGNSWANSTLRPDVSTLTGTAVSGGTTWVVGTRQRSDRLQAVALRGSNGRWSRLDPPTGKGASALTAVDATPSGAVWVVGWKQSGSGWNRPFVARRGNDGWKVGRTAPLPPGEAVLTDVHFASGKRGWITGYHVDADSGRYSPILQRWDGSRWEAVELPFAQDRELIARAVATSGSGRLWLAGTQLAGGEDEVRGWIAELRDDEWIFHLVDTPPDIPTELRALAAGRTGAVAVGSAQPSMLLLETCDVETPADATEDQPIDDATEGPSPAEDAASAGGEDSAGETTAGEEETARRGATRLVAQGKSAPPPFGPTFEPKKWRVRDVSRKHGMETNVKTWAGFIHDIDGNGWDDIFYSRHLLEPPRLLLADENGLRDAPGSGFSVIDRHGCDASDLDGNGQADIFCTVGRVRGTATGRHELSMNPATEQAAIARDSAGAVDPLGRGRYATFIDHDGDGDEDLFLTTIKRRVDGLPGGNHFFENVDGRFVPAPEVGLDTAVGSKCLWSGDIDGDGDEDLINCVANPDDGRPAGVRLYRNDKGRLVDRTAGRGIRPMGDVDVAVADVDGDDLPDLIQLAEGRLRVSTQTDGGFVKTYEASTTNAVAIAAGDVNRDKLADIYVLRGGDKTNGKDFLLVNRGNGTVFQSARIPQTKKGDADDVLAIDFDRNGRTDFVVLNGADRPGPVQLLATLPRK